MKRDIFKQCLVVFFLFFLQIYSYSQQPASSLLWRISGNGLSGSSYLFGTIHAIPANKYFLPEEFKNKLIECDNMVMEIDMANPNMMMELQNEMVMKYQRIDSLLSKEDYQVVSAFFKDSLSIPLMMVNKVKPIFIASFILQKFVGQNPVSYEANFLKLAKDNNKHVGGLETIKEQVSYIDRISLKDQAAMLVESVKDYDKQKKEYQQLVDAYLTGNLDAIYKLMIETTKEYKEFGSILIEERNKNWAELIPAMIRKSSCFIAVGSGHLGGEMGVIHLLQNKGFTVEPVN